MKKPKHSREPKPSPLELSVIRGYKVLLPVHATTNTYTLPPYTIFTPQNPDEAREMVGMLRLAASCLERDLGDC